MRDILQSLVRPDLESKRVRNLPAVIQHSSSLQRIDKSCTQRIRIKHLVPFHPIADRREHAAVSINIHERHIKSPRPGAWTRIPLGAARNYALVVVPPGTV